MFNLENEPKGISMRVVAIGAVIIAGIGFFGGTAVGISHSAPAATIVAAMGIQENYVPPVGIDFTPVWKAWSIIDEKYVPPHAATTTATSTLNGATDSQRRVWGLVEGLAASLDDPYTVFMPPVQAQIFNEDIAGNFEGVGMEIAIRDSILTVISPLKDSPSERAGMKAGDRIIKIDDTETRGMTVEVAVQKIRGPKGTQVTFTVVREGESDTKEIKVTRDVITIPTIKTTQRSDGIFVISLYNFSATSAGLFRGALREFVESGSNKLILDLRGNPGGYLEAAVDIASWFLPQGSIVVTEDYVDKQSDIVHRSRGYNVFGVNLHMIILVDRGSASASEILAGALQYHHIAQLLGTNTFGKGSVQELVPITSDTSLKLTVARWLTPGGVQIPQEGIEPDIMATTTNEQIQAGRDPQLDKAVELLHQMR